MRVSNRDVPWGLDPTVASRAEGMDACFVVSTHERSASRNPSLSMIRLIRVESASGQWDLNMKMA